MIQSGCFAETWNNRTYMEYVGFRVPNELRYDDIIATPIAFLCIISRSALTIFLYSLNAYGTHTPASSSRPTLCSVDYDERTRRHSTFGRQLKRNRRWISVVRYTPGAFLSEYSFQVAFRTFVRWTKQIVEIGSLCEVAYFTRTTAVNLKIRCRFGITVLWCLPWLGGLRLLRTQWFYLVGRNPARISRRTWRGCVKRKHIFAANYERLKQTNKNRFSSYFDDSNFKTRTIDGNYFYGYEN